MGKSPQLTDFYDQKSDEFRAHHKGGRTGGGIIFPTRQCASGRPSKNRPRKAASVHYVLEARAVERTEQIQRKREEAGCFVLLTNIPMDADNGQTGAELLRVYKDQHGIERNFAFIKDPLIANDLFLKKPERVEVLGMVWLIALLVWNLIEHVLRKYIEESESTSLARISVS